MHAEPRVIVQTELCIEGRTMDELREFLSKLAEKVLGAFERS